MRYMMFLKDDVNQALNYENNSIVLRRKMRKSSLLFFCFIMLAVFIGGRSAGNSSASGEFYGGKGA